MVTAFVFWIGTLLLAVVVVSTSGIPSVHYSTRAWVAVAEQGLLATASTTVLWNWGLKQVPASQAGIFINLEPLVGAILGVSLLHEVLGITALAGGANYRRSHLFRLQARRQYPSREQLAVRLKEKPTLNLCSFHKSQVLLVVVRHAINLRLIRLSFVVTVLTRDGVLE
jgi:hypothetical protein